MLKDPQSISNSSMTAASGLTPNDYIAYYYASLKSILSPRGSSNPYGEPDAFRFTKAPEAVLQFLQTVAGEPEYEDVVGRAMGPFDGQLYVWLFTHDLDTDLTRKLFALKEAIEQQSSGEFEIHVEPLDGRTIDELIPSGYSVI